MQSWRHALSKIIVVYIPINEHLRVGFKVQNLNGHRCPREGHCVIVTYKHTILEKFSSNLSEPIKKLWGCVGVVILNYEGGGDGDSVRGEAKFRWWLKCTQHFNWL